MSKEKLPRSIQFKKGRVFYFKGNKCHILEMIECDMVVFKWYSKSKRRWNYKVEGVKHIKEMHKIHLEHHSH